MGKLNTAQKKVIEDVVDNFFNVLGRNSFPTELIKHALESLSKPILSFNEVNHFQDAGIFESLNVIRTILAHPCPQNPTRDVLPEELASLITLHRHDNLSSLFNLITAKQAELEPNELKIKELYERNYQVEEYIKFYLKHRTEKNVIINRGIWDHKALNKGILNLTLLDDNDRTSITKQALIKYLFTLMAERSQQLFGLALVRPSVYACYGAISTEIFDDSAPVLKKWAGTQGFLKNITEKEDGVHLEFSDNKFKIYELSLLHIEREDQFCFIIHNNPAFYDLLKKELASYIKPEERHGDSFKTVLFCNVISTKELPEFLDKLIEIEPSISLLRPSIMANAKQPLVHSGFPWQANLGVQKWSQGVTELEYKNLEFFIKEMCLIFKKEGGVSLDLKFNDVYRKAFRTCLKQFSYPIPWFFLTSPGNYTIDFPHNSLLNNFLDVLLLLGLFDEEMLDNLKTIAKLYLKSLKSLNGWLKDGDFNEEFASYALLNREVIYNNLSQRRIVEQIAMRGYKEGNVFLNIDIISKEKDDLISLLQAHNFNASKHVGDVAFKIPNQDYLTELLELLQQKDPTLTNEVADDIFQSYANSYDRRKTEVLFHHHSEMQMALFFASRSQKQTEKRQEASSSNVVAQPITPAIEEDSNEGGVSDDMTDEEMADYFSSLGR